ncbi:MAG: hypothetical protein ACRC33_20835 [Gemmataceae bacterium]
MPLPPEAEVPVRHYQQTIDDHFNLGLYAINRFHANSPAARRHLGRLNGMLLVSSVETFERFLKELAALCIDQLGRHVLDDRFDVFRVQGSALAVHFDTDTLGRALCESSTWLDTAAITSRFRALLADPFEDGRFVLFPTGRKDDLTDRERYETLELVWQLRHTVVHNVGVITRSDAVKLRLLVRATVQTPALLAPTWDDLKRLKRFLDAAARYANDRVGVRLADLLTALHQDDPSLFEPRQKADELSSAFALPLTVAAAAGVLPAP